MLPIEVYISTQQRRFNAIAMIDGNEVNLLRKAGSV